MALNKSARKPPPPKVTVAVRRLFRREAVDYAVMVSIVLFLVLFGLVMVLSSSFVGSALGNDGNFFATFFRQMFWVLLGLPGMFLVSRISPTLIKRFASVFFFASLCLQALVFTPLGVSSGGNTNWISVGGLTGQPSELLKVSMIIWLAYILSNEAHDVRDHRTLLRPVGVGVLAAVGLVMLGADLGTSGILILIALGTVFVAGARVSHLAILLVLIIIGVTALAAISPSRVNRIMTWFSGCSPEDYLGTCWQIVHSIYALGSGGIFGVGLGNSRAKWSWLPEAETDFIFAIVGEELGLLGASLVIGSFLALAIVMTRLVRAQQDPFSRLVTVGVMVWLIGQALINIAVVLEVLPVLGVPLPFMSVGGSALVASLLAVGIVMALNREQNNQSSNAIPVKNGPR